MIGNAHLDPVWLWHWQRGSDEAIATCRAACDILDDYHDVIFTRGEAWVYEQVRLLDPALFERIRNHVQTGRWDVVGGWWIQPDVNLPTEEAILRSASLGRAWFQKHLGITNIAVGYNVDSFGQGAYLPRMLQRSGQKYYVMMRPAENEASLSSCLFRWRSPDNSEVLTFRIIGGYNSGSDPSWNVKIAVENAPKRIGHVMCFYGVGDHGGGPTRAAIEWIRAHRNFATGVTLEFSSPTRFFQKVEHYRDSLPVVAHELQMHAIGCYSICGRLKRTIREAEFAAIDADDLLNESERPTTQIEARELETAWQLVCFNQFHDILPGSAVSEAVETAIAQIGSARTLIDSVVHTRLRTNLPHGADDRIEGHRIHVVNRVARPWSGLAEVEIWLDWQAWNHHLEDATGHPVPFQMTQPSSLIFENWGSPIPRLLFPADLLPLEHKVLRIAPGPAPATQLPRTDSAWAGGVLDNGCLTVRFDSRGVSRISDSATGRDLLSAPVELICLNDESDTWSHNIDRFKGPVRHIATFCIPLLIEDGPLRTTVRLDGNIGKSPCHLFVSLEQGSRAVHMTLSTNYQESHSVLKVRIATSSHGIRCRHRVAGGWIERPMEEREYPVHHAIRMETEADAIGVVMPDTFAADVSAEAIRPTLVRNSLHAYSCGYSNSDGKRDFNANVRVSERFGSDEGPQSVRWSITFGDLASEDALTKLMDALQRPPHIWDDFRGLNRLSRFDAT